MGGNLSVEEVNVLVSNNPILPAMAYAFEEQIEIVSKKWVDACFEMMERVDFGPFRLQRFNGLVVVASDLMPNRVRLLKQLVNERCGKWNESLNNETSILVTERLGNTQKIKMAMMHSIPIVSPEWILKQVQTWTNIEPYVLNFWCLKNIKTDLFNDIHFEIHERLGDEIEVLQMAIEANSGSISEKPDFVIVDNFYIGDDDRNYVTASWVWDCISKQKLIPITGSIIYQPFNYSIPSNDFKGFTVALNVLNDNLRYELSECLRALGISIHLRVSKVSNIIVSENVNEELIDLSLKYGIEIVSVDWVFDLVKMNALPPTQNYILTREYCEKISLQNGKYIDINDLKEKQSSPLIKIENAEIRTPINVTFDIQKDSLLSELLNS